MSFAPNTLSRWTRQPSLSPGPMNTPLALQALIQNQVDQILKQCHRRDWAHWTHEDLRHEPPASQLMRKRSLLEEYHGLLSGLGVVALNEDVWTPVYVLSITVPQSQLVETSHSSDMHVCDVLWEHKPSRALSITLFNNHLEEESSFRHFVVEGLSSKRPSQWISVVGRRGHGFLRAVCSLMTELHKKCPPNKTDNSAFTPAVSLRVGDSVGEFGWSERKDADQQDLMLRRFELRSLSLKGTEGKPDFVFPFEQDASQAVRELSKEIRIAAVLAQSAYVRGRLTATCGLSLG